MDFRSFIRATHVTTFITGGFLGPPCHHGLYSPRQTGSHPTKPSEPPLLPMLTPQRFKVDIENGHIYKKKITFCNHQRPISLPKLPIPTFLPGLPHKLLSNQSTTSSNQYYKIDTPHKSKTTDTKKKMTIFV